MEISATKIYDQKDLINVLMRANLRGDPNIKPYSKARIYIKRTRKEDVVPAQRFVLSEQLEIIGKLDKYFYARGVDVLNNRGFITYAVEGECYCLTPPIIEIIDGRPLLIDGIHRMTYAGNRGIAAVFVDGIPPQWYPWPTGLAGGWSDVMEFDGELPQGFVGKYGRYPDELRKYYFRDYQFPARIKIARAHSRIR